MLLNKIIKRGISLIIIISFIFGNTLCAYSGESALRPPLGSDENMRVA